MAYYYKKPNGNLAPLANARKESALQLKGKDGKPYFVLASECKLVHGYNVKIQPKGKASYTRFIPEKEVKFIAGKPYQVLPNDDLKPIQGSKVNALERKTKNGVQYILAENCKNVAGWAMTIKTKDGTSFTKFIPESEVIVG